MIHSYLVANYIINIDSPSDAEMESRLRSYIYDTDSEPDISISVSSTSDDISVRRENLTKLSDAAYFYSNDDNDVLFYYDTNIGKAFAKLTFDKSYSNISIELYDLKSNHGVDDVNFMYNMTGIAVSYAVNMHGGFVFHSSSVACDGCGVAFSALSGTGKSTHTKLWLDNFEGSFILNDDTPIISKGSDGEFYISGTPWAGTTGINANVTVPLKGLVFLERGIDNSIEQIPSAMVFSPFFEALRPMLTDSMMSNVLSTLNDLLIKVPAYRLKCNMDPEAAFVAKEGIYGKR